MMKLQTHVYRTIVFVGHTGGSLLLDSFIEPLPSGEQVYLKHLYLSSAFPGEVVKFGSVSLTKTATKLSLDIKGY